MRAAFLLLFSLTLALLAAALAPVFLADPGVVQIRFRGWTLEMSVLVLVFGILFSCLIVYLVIRIWRLPAETARKVREQRALKQLEKGLLALTEGDWATAERALQKSSSAQGQTTARYLAAAQAANGQNAAERMQTLKNQAAAARLGKCEDLEQLQSTWQSLPKAMKKSAQIVLAFAQTAARLGAPEQSESILRASLRQQWDSALLMPYGNPGPTDAGQRLKQCEKWLIGHPDDARLHLALGRLCAREQLWGKARHHMIRSLELEPTVAGYDALGQLLERQGDLEQATACFRNALRMNQGELPVPLPADHARLKAPADSVQ